MIARLLVFACTTLIGGSLAASELVTVTAKGKITQVEHPEGIIPYRGGGGFHKFEIGDEVTASFSFVDSIRDRDDLYRPLCGEVNWEGGDYRVSVIYPDMRVSRPVSQSDSTVRKFWDEWREWAGTLVFPDVHFILNEPGRLPDEFTLDAVQYASMDLDVITSAIGATGHHPEVRALADSVVETRQSLVPGDVNGDGVFNQLDLVRILSDGERFNFGAEIDPSPFNCTWVHGDWNSDGRFDQLDIIEALPNYQSGAVQAMIVPEPWTIGLLLLAMMLFLFAGRHEWRR